MNEWIAFTQQETQLIAQLIFVYWSLFFVKEITLILKDSIPKFEKQGEIFFWINNDHDDDDHVEDVDDKDGHKEDDGDDCENEEGK